jgi:hypothetical protein
MSLGPVTSDEIRIFLMDKPELNTLINGVRFTDQQLEQAQINCVDYYNLAPPSTGSETSIETFPSRYLLIIGTAGYLLRSAAINQASNEFTYSAEGVQVADHDKAGIFSKLGTDLWEEFKEMVRNKKVQMNVARVYGTIRSEFSTRVF